MERLTKKNTIVVQALVLFVFNFLPNTGVLPYSESLAFAANNLPVILKTTIMDTLEVYGGPETLDGKFQTVDGQPDQQEWTTADGTETFPDHWHISTFNAANLDPTVPENHAFWCGEMIPACPSDTDGGYGNAWNTSLAWRGAVADPSLPAVITVTGILNNDTEPGYDFTSLNFGTWGNVFQDALSVDGEVLGLEFSESFTYNPNDYLGDLGEVMVRFTFQSDGGWSDEDCIWPTSGASQVDNLQVTVSQAGYPDYVSPVQTCEPGASVQWDNIPNKGHGNYAQLWTNLQDVDPDVDNFSPQWAFIDDGIIEPGTGGTLCRNGVGCYGPGSYVVNVYGGLSGDWKILNHVISPAIELPILNSLPDDPEPEIAELVLFADAYLHDFGGTRGLGFEIISTSDPSGLEGWMSSFQDTLFYEGPIYTNYNATWPMDSLVPDARFVKIQITAMDTRNWWPGPDSTPAPYFDNVRLQAGLTNAVAPVLEIQAGFQIQVYPNPFNPRSTVSFSLDHSQVVELSIFDLTGKRVAILADRLFQEGNHSLDWEGRDLQGNAVASGTYLARMVSDEGVTTEKMMLIR